jgi:basic membrane lipoprotein Med (substrate-binding protein (PBP1-ABC) superfamily)
MKKDELKKKVNDVGHAIDDGVEAAAEKHNFAKWQVWLGLAAAVLLVALVAKVWL